MIIRSAKPIDKLPLETLINDAYQASDFFKYEKRINQEKLAHCFEKGELLVSEDTSGISGCIHWDFKDALASFGLLSVSPFKQRSGIGRLLIDEVEQRAITNNCNAMDIQIVNLREELFSFYTKLGYVQISTAPFYTPTKLPCHFINMRKIFK